MRRLPALLTAAALATVLASSLTACSGVPGFGGCEPAYQPGDASELVTYAKRDFAPKPQRLRSVISLLDAIPNKVASAHANATSCVCVFGRVRHCK